MTIDALKNSRKGLIRDIEIIDNKRSELKVEIVLANKRSGVSKDKVAGLMADRASLLQDRGVVRENLVKINNLIRSKNKLKCNNKSVNNNKESALHRCFFNICKSQLPQEMFCDILNIAKDKINY
jgi:hypothetical protein